MNKYPNKTWELREKVWLNWDLDGLLMWIFKSTPNCCGSVSCQATLPVCVCGCACFCVRVCCVCDSTTSSSIYWLHISFTSVSERRHRGAVSVSLAAAAGGVLINQSNFLNTAATAAQAEGETHLVPGWRISQGAPLPNGVSRVYVLRQHARHCRCRCAGEKIDSR